ncbi:MAG: hypothetical protein IJ403_03750 [Oscillospiraceae bacterium]|nr:hypothetical protein [Oscillospiraceae bacterium]
MKKILALLLILVLLAPMIPARAETVAIKPYYAIGSSDFNRTKFPNLEGRLMVSVVVENGEVYLSASGAGRDINKIASTIKNTLDSYPEGMRTFVLHKSSDVFQLQEDTIYFEEGVEKLRTVFSQFIKAYAELGGKLDGVVLDVEYVDTYNWYLYSKQYTKGNTDVYKNIVENPRYKTDVRPLLEERGFQFYPDAYLTEIWSAYPRLKGAEKAEYADCLTIWDTVMRIRLNNYMTYAVYEPLAQHMPNVPVYDYQSRATAAWLKDLSDKGEHKYVAGNSVPVGITSHYNTYGSRLTDDFFVADGQPAYKNPVAYNGAEFAATPFNRILWDVNLMKNMYAASDGNVAITVAEYDYSPDKVGTPSNTPYYTESIFHIGLLDPKPFCIYMYDKAFETTAEYNKRAKVLQQIMAELTRVAGYADRKPIEVPATWNSPFLLSGIYANGRNLWRLTPDMDQIDPEKFAVAAKDPTFTAKGQTITFPQGKLIETASISVVGSYGYWIETPKNVTPVITNDADRFSKNPSFAEDFEKYNVGTVFNAATAKPQLSWQVTGDNPTVQSVNGGKALALTGTTTVTNQKLPQNITAGDYYAKQQVWEVSVTLPQNMDGELKLLTCGDGGIRIADGKVYYDAEGSYEELPGVRLTAGQKYTLKREVDFRNGQLCNYTVLNAAGKVIGQAKDIPMKKISLPVTKIAISCADVTGKIFVDDYKLYPTGVTADMERYNAKTGIQLKDAKSSEDVAYRLSWLNGSNETEDMEVVATFHSADSKQVSQKVIQKVQMKPGCDGVETGIVEVPRGQIVTLVLKKAKPTAKPTTSTEPTAAPTTKPTEGQTVKPTEQQTTKPSVAKPTRPSTQVSHPTATKTPIGNNATNETRSTEVTTEDTLTAPTQASAEFTQNTGNTHPPEVSDDKNAADHTVLWIVIAAIGLGGAGAVVYFLYFEKKKTKE